MKGKNRFRKIATAHGTHISSIKQVVSPKQYIKIVESTPDIRFKRTTIIPPRLGEEGFGKILIER